jgi:hypothetical protein
MKSISEEMKLKKSELDYTKADVWSLGQVLANMMSTPNRLKACHDLITDGRTKLLLPNILPPPTSTMHENMKKCYEVVNYTLQYQPADRWSCYQLHLFTQPPVKPAPVPVPITSTDPIDHSISATN